MATENWATGKMGDGKLGNRNKGNRKKFGATEKCDRKKGNIYITAEKAAIGIACQHR